MDGVGLILRNLDRRACALGPPTINHTIRGLSPVRHDLGLLDRDGRGDLLRQLVLLIDALNDLGLEVSAKGEEVMAYKKKMADPNGRHLPVDPYHFATYTHSAYAELDVDDGRFDLARFVRR